MTRILTVNFILPHCAPLHTHEYYRMNRLQLSAFRTSELIYKINRVTRSLKGNGNQTTYIQLQTTNNPIPTESKTLDVTVTLVIADDQRLDSYAMVPKHRYIKDGDSILNLGLFFSSFFFNQELLSDSWTEQGNRIFWTLKKEINAEEYIEMLAKTYEVTQ